MLIRWQVAPGLTRGCGRGDGVKWKSTLRAEGKSFEYIGFLHKLCCGLIILKHKRECS
jgi:hypothetical protein